MDLSVSSLVFNLEKYKTGIDQFYSIYEKASTEGFWVFDY